MVSLTTTDADTVGIANINDAVGISYRIEGRVITRFAGINHVVSRALLPNVQRTLRAEQINPGATDLHRASQRAAKQNRPLLRVHDNRPRVNKRPSQLELPGESWGIGQRTIDDQFGVAR